MTVAPGTQIPPASFNYIPHSKDSESIQACGIPISLNAHEEWKGKRVVVISVPGAFTPTCHANHLPPFVAKASEIHDKGADVIAFLSSNDPFVLSAWAKSAGVKDNSIIFISDGNAEWSKQLGLDVDLTSKGMGMRSSRYALIIDDLKLSYVAQEEPGKLQVSSADAILANL
ncbi:Putative peroxiredoxin [Wallemia ichthyophaga EXF-994]|uniref:Putative peroxiredoxin n=1 Tax=Wallemia ichthyophaga (strain EXF-994 / CBS 113033) TaxID=1299270 RepID=R9AKW9_WALI9|nr:Putative peroxiredoxin [Wallemia ichthyophaga EXF-994]EOR02858.1 Putative peroxiredoxin [Wallemia ichthyophaga EXF-994]